METACKSNTRFTRKILIIVPQIDDSGPVKGALALSQGLRSLGVTTVCVPMGVTENSRIDSDCDMSVAKARGWFGKIRALRQMVAKAGLNHQVSIVSFCFRPDFLTLASGLRRISMSSLRGNLVANYSMQYGIAGKWLAILHYGIAILHARTVVLNQSMFDDLRRYTSRIDIIENFINELPIERKRNVDSNPVFIFVGGLTRRKGIVELIDAFSEVRRQGNNFSLLVLGEGPERVALEQRIQAHGLSDNISLLGQVGEPFDYLSSADCFILPSHSEGTSRAAMEALYAGLPCIMRDVDSNADLVATPKQGELFSTHSELIDKISIFCREHRPRAKENLLPTCFRQEFGAQRYLNLICSLGAK